MTARDQMLQRTALEILHRIELNYAVAADSAGSSSGNRSRVGSTWVGPEGEIGATVREFLEMSRENGWAVAFYQTLPDFLPMYLRLGMKKLKIGDEAMVDLPDFSLQGKSKRELRSKVRQLEAIGIHTREFQPPVPDSIIAQLKAVSDQWLRIPGRRERSFTLGQFDPDYLRSEPVLVVLDSAGTVLAFINLISVNRSEITGDLMRRRTDAPNGTMDYLFIKLFLYARERGYARVIPSARGSITWLTTTKPAPQNCIKLGPPPNLVL